MKKRIIVLLSLLLVCIFGIFIYFNVFRNHNVKTHTPTTTTLNTEIKEIDSKIEDETPITDTEVIEDNTSFIENENTTKKDSNPTKEQSKQKAVNNNHTETKQEIVSSNTPEEQKSNNIVDNSSNNEVVKENTTPAPTTEEKKYIGVADPNNFNYSFHNGKVEYKTEQACRDDWDIIGFKDTVDIINGWCVDVRDSNNTILGYYLYINCSSGNCNKYKN